MHEGEHLRKLLGSRNKAEFSRTHGVPGGASMLSQHISGHRAIGLESAIVYARALGVPLDTISPSQAAVVRKAVSLLDESAPQVLGRQPALSEALPVVLDAIAACPARAELERLLPLLVTGAQPYRDRVAELLAPVDEKPLGAPIAPEHDERLRQMAVTAEELDAQHRSDAGSGRQRHRASG